MDNLYISDIKSLAGKRRKLSSGLRHGQSLFNALYELHPALANSIRGGVSDCFYDDGKIEMFLAELIKFGYI